MPEAAAVAAADAPASPEANNPQLAVFFVVFIKSKQTPVQILSSNNTKKT
jgi:hypothetical protein